MRRFPFHPPPRGLQRGPLIRQCHEQTRKASPHVVTLIKIEGNEGEQHNPTRNVTSIEEMIGHTFDCAGGYSSEQREEK